MKHLRRFNEGLDDGDGLKEYCEMSLAYLMDEGFALNWSRVYGDNPTSPEETWMISIRKPIDRYNYEVFSWMDVKDQIIRFAHLISRKYETLPFNERTGKGNLKRFRLLLPKWERASGAPMTTPTRDYTLEELEDLDDDFLLTSFSLKVVDKV
jgi:hypothetical protein